ncbi:MAG: phosphate uptake regulator PhoU [Nitrososphaerota archaeon]|nr:phosphate uptake regulator PhoU [Nitrososphaerota archaeon]
MNTEEEIVQQQNAQSKIQTGETRRVQLTGGSTLVVSLPSDWARGVGLKAKDEVHMVPQTDMSLLVIPGIREEKVPERVIEISQKEDEDEVLRQFIAYYVSGFDSIRLKFKSQLPEMRSKLKTHIRHKLIGVEIDEETTDNILTQGLHGNVDLPLKKALSRMSIIASSMQFDAVKSLSTGDPALASEIIDRDDEVDRFAHFISRQLNLAVHNRVMIQEIGLATAQDCMNYRMIVKSIERIADHAAQIAGSEMMLDKRRVPPQLNEHILKLSKMSNDVYENSLRALHSMSGKMANEAIFKLRGILKEEELATEELINSRLDNKSVVSLRLALESLRRVAEYSTDICEIIVNMIVGSPL